MVPRLVLDKDAILHGLSEQLGDVSIKIHTEEAEWCRHESSLNKLIGALQERRSRLKLESDLKLCLLRSQRLELEGKLRDVAQL